jgi:hypothetical protein
MCVTCFTRNILYIITQHTAKSENYELPHRPLVPPSYIHSSVLFPPPSETNLFLPYFCVQYIENLVTEETDF